MVLFVFELLVEKKRKECENPVLPLFYLEGTKTAFNFYLCYDHFTPGILTIENMRTRTWQNNGQVESKMLTNGMLG